MSGHCRADYLTAVQGDEKQFGLDSKFCRDCDLGPIPRRIIRECFAPERFDTGEMVRRLCNDFRNIRHNVRFTTSTCISSDVGSIRERS
jgi:hypothetical protein